MKDLRHQSRRVRSRVPLESRVVHFRFVEPRAGVPAVLELPDDHVVEVVDGGLKRAHRAVHVAEVSHVRFVPVAEAQLEGRLGIEHVIQLAEHQRFAERRREVPVVLREIDGIECGEAGRRIEADEVCAVLVIALVRAEKEQLVPLDRPTQAQAH